MNILGISAFYHDSAAALVTDGVIVAAAQEERFTRLKHDSSFPRNAVKYCLDAGSIGAMGIDAVAFYEKPITKFARLVSSYATVAPRGFSSMRRAIPLWMRSKLWIPLEIEKQLQRLGFEMPGDLYFTEHHESHAASAFFPSPYPSAAIVTSDAVGEWATASLGLGRDNEISLLREQRFPHSLGLLYSAFTEYCGFRVNSGEYKLMGLAPFGEPTYVQEILDDIVDLRPDGSFRLNMKYFGFLTGLRMTSKSFHQLFGGPPRHPEAPITKREMDLARSIQDVTELMMMRMVRAAAVLTGERRLCMAGGVALNAVANGRVVREGPFEEVWIQPAAGDAGGAVGCALYTWHQIESHPRSVDGRTDGMSGALLGPSFTGSEVRSYLEANDYPFEVLDDGWQDTVARLLADGKVVAVFQGRMEYGPRALGNRSILGDPRSPIMQSTINQRVKFRESFRPFAPAILEDQRGDYFNLKGDSPYMLLVAPLREGVRRPVDESPDEGIRERLAKTRSEIPAVTHVDYSARVQTVSQRTNPAFHGLLAAFHRLTGCPVLVNTSFNVRGEPIVCNPADAYRTFMGTGIDYLVMEGHLLDRSLQPQFAERDNWLESMVLD